MSAKIPNVDHYLQEGCGRCSKYSTPDCKVHTWSKELSMLRTIVLETGLTEEIKWGMPCYTYKNANILVLSAFKDFCSLNLFKGALLNDEANLLEKAGENSQAARQLRFTNTLKIKELVDTIKAYIFEAIEVEKSGIKVEMKKLEDYAVPEELTQKLEQDSTFATAFNKLTTGRRKAYILFFNDAKQAATRVSRIEKYTDRILKGFGMNDCVCGLSKRKPNCDGSHRMLK